MGFAVYVVFGALVTGAIIISFPLFGTMDTWILKERLAISDQAEAVSFKRHTEIAITGVNTSYSTVDIYVENTGGTVIDPGQVFLVIDGVWVDQGDYSLAMVGLDSSTSSAAGEYWEPGELVEIGYSGSSLTTGAHTVKVVAGGGGASSSNFSVLGDFYLGDDGAYDPSDADDILSTTVPDTQRNLAQGAPDGGDFDTDSYIGLTLVGGQNTTDPLQYQDFLSGTFTADYSLNGTLNFSEFWLKTKTGKGQGKEGCLNLSLYEYNDSGPSMSLIAAVWECKNNWGVGAKDEYDLVEYNFSAQADYTIQAGNRLLLRMTAETTHAKRNLEFIFMFDSIDISTLNEYKAHIEVPSGG
jgi:archaellum component FlaF (FlaF/FlaG flagellin family)